MTNKHYSYFLPEVGDSLRLKALHLNHISETIRRMEDEIVRLRREYASEEAELTERIELNWTSEEIEAAKEKVKISQIIKQ